MLKKLHNRKFFKYSLITGTILTTILQNQVFSSEESQKLPEVIVTADRIEEPLEESTSDIIVITEKEIKKMNVEWVADALRKLPNLYVKQTGGPGKQTSVFLRTSTKAGDTLIMIDGVKVNDPTLGEFDFSSLSVDEIERIEIINGPQSTLYGSEAMAGVINIITKKGKGKPKINISLEGGSYGTYKPAFNLYGGTEKINYRITSFYYKTDGFSAYKDGDENDGYKNAFISGKFGFKPSKKLEFEFLGRYYYDRNEIDTSSGDDPDYIGRTHHLLISGKIKLYLTSYWEQILNFSKVKNICKHSDPTDLYNNSKITPAIYIINWQHNFYLSKIFTFIIGTEYRKEEGKYEDAYSNFDEDVENKAIYINNKIKLLNNNLILNGGIRYDNHQTFGEKTTYRIGFLYNIIPYALKIKANYGTAFKAPTLDDLFWPGSGNPNLKPEEAWGWDAGIEKDFLNEKIKFSLGFFYQKYKNLIQWAPVSPGSWIWQPQNIGKANIKGSELNFTFTLTRNLIIRSGYTYLDTENEDNNKYLRFKPMHKFFVSGKYNINKFSLFAEYLYTGERYNDVNNQEKLKSYSLINLSVTYKLSPNLSLFGRIDNLLNTNYEEVKDYETPDRSFYAGIRFSY